MPRSPRQTKTADLGLTPESAAALIREHGSIDRAAVAGGFPIGAFRRFCRKHRLTARNLGSWGVGRKNAAGSVYWIRAVGTPAVKVGIALDPYERLQHLQVGSHLDLRLEATVYADDATALERYWHQRLQHRRIRAEWFDLGSHAVSAVLMGDIPKGKLKVAT